MPPSMPNRTADVELAANPAARDSMDRYSIDHENEDSLDQPFLVAPDEDSWRPPPGFAWIQTAIMANVFLNGFDYTITATTYTVISSEFDAANTASWLTTSYLVTATAFQPLYGRVSDIFGRRICFFTSTVTFAAGCLGCGIASNIVFLNVMRALTGFGGGGLMTMGRATYSMAILCLFEGLKAYHVLMNYSNNRQFRYDPLPQARHVPSHAKRRIRLRFHSRRFIRRRHSRPHRLAMVLPLPSPNIHHGIYCRLVRAKRPRGRVFRRSRSQHSVETSGLLRSDSAGRRHFDPATRPKFRWQRVALDEYLGNWVIGREYRFIRRLFEGGGQHECHAHDSAADVEREIAGFYADCQCLCWDGCIWCKCLLLSL